MPETTPKQHISLHIYDQEIPINVLPDQEYYYREACNLINDRLNRYFNSYKGKKADKTIMYFVMIDLAVNFVRKSESVDTTALDGILGKLTEEIEAALDQK